jgi:transcriptional regulator with XRE-family HTH domain
MISKVIGKKLFDKREELKLSPKEIASELGISARAYLDIESGTVDIKASKLVVLKDLLQISIATMFNEENSQAYNISGNSTQSGHVVNFSSKDLLDKITELYERIIELEKKK